MQKQLFQSSWFVNNLLKLFSPCESQKVIIFGEKKLGLAVISECEIFMIKVPGKTHQAGFLSYYHFNIEQKCLSSSQK